MKSCPKCGRPVDKGSICGSCGHPLTDAQPSSRPKASRSPVLAIALAVCGIGSLILLASATRSPTTPPISESPSRRTTETVPVSDRDVTARPVESASRRPTPHWTARGESAGRRRQPKVITFELVADRDVAVWRSLVRPVLTIRCLAGTSEVFILTNSAASLEPDTRLHTIKLSFDDGAELVQMWEHSVNHDALFAPDGGALAHQIARADRMSFTFTPFNASPAVATFSVAGFSAQVQTAARKSCGWKTS